MRGITILLGLLAACSSGSSGPSFALLGGKLSAIQGMPQLAVPGDDVEPNGALADARLVDTAPAGTIDGARDPVDAYRLIAHRDGWVTASLEGAGDVTLHDLETGAVGRTLDLAAGAVYDVVVVAGGASGAYHVRLDDAAPGAAGPAPALPAGYRCRGDGHVRGELVVAPLDGVSAAALGYEQAGGDGPIRRWRAAGRAGDDDERDLCRLLADAARLRAAGLVRYAEPNYRRRLTATPLDPLFAAQWGLTQIRAAAAWDHTTGAGAPVIAVVDSGIRAAHPDLLGRVLPGYDFESDDTDPTDPDASFSHGTATAGIIAASGNNGTGVSGVLWNGRILPVRAFDVNGFGDAAAIANAILYAAGLANSSGTVPAEAARVINLSFASEIQSQAERDACNAAQAAGAILIAAAGNSNSSGVRYPAGYGSVVAVAATTITGARASYSNFGGWIDLAAPGGTVTNGVLAPTIDALGQYSYLALEGTSFAAPHVSGTAALVLAADPGLTSDEVRTLLVGTAQDVGAPGFDTEFGYGIVDAYRAVLSALGLAPPPVLPGEQVQVRLVHQPSGIVLATVFTNDNLALAWTIYPVGPGLYTLEAGTDRDSDGSIDDPGEIYGRWTDPFGGELLAVDRGMLLPALNFTLSPR